MFAYCGNNPVNCVDPSGYVKKYIPYFDNINDNKYGETDIDSCQTQTYSGTISVGIAGSVGVGPWIFGGQLILTLDANGYAALQYAPYAGGFAGPASDSFSASILPFVMITDAPGYQALEGDSIQVGASYAGATLDYIGVLDSTGQNVLYQGIVAGYGASLPDVHITGSSTETLFAVEFDWDTYWTVTQY